MPYQTVYFITGIQRQATVKVYILIFRLKHWTLIQVPRYFSIIISMILWFPLDATEVPSHWLLLSNYKQSSGSRPRANSMPGDQGTKIISSNMVPKSRSRDEAEVRREAQSLVLNPCPCSTLSVPFVTFQMFRNYIHLPTWPFMPWHIYYVGDIYSATDPNTWYELD